MTTASFGLPPASLRSRRAGRDPSPVSAATIRPARARSLALVGLTSTGSVAFQVQYQRTTGGSSQIRASTTRRGGQTTTAWFSITDAAHAVEIGWQSATSAAVTLSIDGVVVQTLTSLDTGSYRIETVRLGPSTGLANGMNGNGYVDGFVSTRTSAIGP